MTIIFVDTNVLLHAKPLQDINWEVLEPVPITIIVTRTNVRELDKHKDQHPKRHMRERALKALKRIEEAAAKPELRSNVMLLVDHRQPRIDWGKYDLDGGYPDDALIGSIVEYRSAHINDAVVIYTHDVGPRLTATRLGIRTRELPETEKLPPERDETERDNERLKRELHELKTAAPALVLAINDQRTYVDATPLKAKPEALDDEQIDARVAEARDKLPRFDLDAIPDTEPTYATRDERGRILLDLTNVVDEASWSAIPRREYVRYELERSEYANAYREFLRAEYAAAEERSRTFRFDLSLFNDGGAPAEDIHVTITVPEHVNLVEKLLMGLPLPKAPKQPRSEQEQLAESMAKSVFPARDVYTPRLPTIDYQSTGPDIDGTSATWRVRSLNHRLKPQSLGKLYATMQGKLTPFAVTYTIHAANSVKQFSGEILIRPIEDRVNEKGS